VKEEGKKETPKKEEKAEEVRSFRNFLFYFAADFSLFQSKHSTSSVGDPSGFYSA